MCILFITQNENEALICFQHLHGVRAVKLHQRHLLAEKLKMNLKFNLNDMWSPLFTGLVPDHLIMNALAYQADPTCVDPAKLSPTPQRGGRRRSQARSMSVQSSLDPYGSSTTLNSESASSEIESSPRLSSDGSRGSPLGRLSNWQSKRSFDD